jgi:hypothetical protein
VAAVEGRVEDIKRNKVREAFKEESETVEVKK